jgi:hypothetical protein
MEAADAPPKFAGHSNAITGLKNWIEAVGPKYVLGQLLLPRSAEIFSLSLPMRVIAEAERLVITPAMSRASADSRASGRGSANLLGTSMTRLTPTGASALSVPLPPPGTRLVPQPPSSSSALASPMSNSNAATPNDNNNGRNGNSNYIIIIKNNNSSVLPPPGPSAKNTNNNNQTPPPRLTTSNNNNNTTTTSNVTFTPQPPRNSATMMTTNQNNNNNNQNNNNNNNYATFTNQQQDVYSPGAVDQLSPDIVAAINSISNVHPGLGRAIALTTAAAMLSRAEL